MNQYSGTIMKSFHEISLNAKTFAIIFQTMKVGNSLLSLFLTKYTYDPLVLLPKVNANPEAQKNNASPGTPPVAKDGLTSLYKEPKCELVINKTAITFSKSSATFLFWREIPPRYVLSYNLSSI